MPPFPIGAIYTVSNLESYDGIINHASYNTYELE